MRALLIEDEAVAAETLRRMLAEFAPELEVEPPLASISAAIARLSKAPAPDLIFMDVQLADGLSFEIFDALPASAPVIFTTAYDAFALQAFDSFGIDYLLKPIKPSRLAAALAKWRMLVHRGEAMPRPGAGLAQRYFRDAQQYRSRFLVQQGETLVSIPTTDVAYFHKALVVRLVARDGRGFALSQSLDDIERMLDPASFFRLNRQVLAHADAMSQVHRGFKGKLDVTLSPPLDAPASVSQERAGALREWLDR